MARKASSSSQKPATCIEMYWPSGLISRWRLQAGLSLIELLMFIVIMSLAVAGILTVLNLTAQKSADPQVRRQMLAMAEALLEEVMFKPFTYCDPDDPNAATAASSAGCTGG